ncbi:hypothetical protein RRV45_20255 [Bacillus sp. DTU_2020_1000418_1_SI_GHA_SEK_038]|uniref:hypothetical protein n=1 Tax=Bacillus sp. DTU_2020_1000418_1_SI_GHA_SEK_038 TaxID=3077585 RepID=UPI0028EDBDF0|nr:hypothetical protein [Bacillus sp. DTU_2020_1000418_1_SI_GHA_SEK_038]WNS75180.1 hypothetical protein RRV45_20255 [Bacillus sp. DTU_2020_1000418_1_SI_GHA_SEK_038]
MTKTLKARVKTGKALGMRGRKPSLETKNAIMSKQIEELHLQEKQPILKVNQNGVVTNLDYNNPQHMRWLED